MSQETGLMEEFISRMGRNNGLFTYGLNDTLQAAEMGAIEKLMVTDILMRTIGSEKQNAIEKLFTLVENSRGEITILSSSSPAGDQLQKFGGIASLFEDSIPMIRVNEDSGIPLLDWIS
jgi:protein pelota